MSWTEHQVPLIYRDLGSAKASTCFDHVSFFLLDMSLQDHEQNQGSRVRVLQCMGGLVFAAFPPHRQVNSEKGDIPIRSGILATLWRGWIVTVVR